MQIYTKTGDAGETGLFAGPRVAKDHVRIEAYGEVDELNSVIGVARAEDGPESIDALLAAIQHDLFALGAELATPDPAKQGTMLIGEDRITALEQAIDEHVAGLPPLKEFILPGGTRLAGALHLGRTVCRRAERRVVTLASVESEQVSGRAIRYLNRLSDLLFVLARSANAAANVSDVKWMKS